MALLHVDAESKQLDFSPSLWTTGFIVITALLLANDFGMSDAQFGKYVTYR